MRSPLENFRLQSPLHLPDQLHHFATLGERVGEKTESQGDKEAMQARFPKTYGQPCIEFEPGKRESHASLRVGVVLSGGQAPGGHNVILGLFQALKELHGESHLYGFEGGPAGVVEGNFSELTLEVLEGYRNMGGFDLLGSGRTKIETQEQLEAAKKHVEALELDGLVVIGGDDSNTNAALLAEYFLGHGCKTKVVGVPKTIDGDLKNTYVEQPFGFDTACRVYAEMIGNIARDALSAKKYTHFIRLMGRSASHITLECALQTQPNVTLIGEEVAAKGWTLTAITDYLAAVIRKRAEAGKKYGVILLPEGLIEFIPEMRLLITELNSLKVSGNNIEALSREGKATFESLPESIQRQLFYDRDPHGNVQVSHIATEQLLSHLIAKQCSDFHPVHHFFGYEGRSAMPSNFDATYCYALGFAAAGLIDGGHSGYMGVVRHLAEAVEKWEIAGIPLTMLMNLEERKGRLKPVIQKTLVDLECEPFRYLEAHRKEWEIEDHYRSPGPIQFVGPPHLCDATTLTLKLEQSPSLCT